jgi:hypothetical protein
MKIMVTKDWLGSREGDVLDLEDNFARHLIANGKAKRIKDSENKMMDPNKQKIVTKSVGI